MNQVDLRAFVERYFSQMKAGKHEDVPGVFRYDIPPERRGGLNSPSVRVTFDPSMAERYEGVELLVPGSLLLDRIFQDASSHGHHCVAKVEGGKSPPAADVLAANLSFGGVKNEVLTTSSLEIPFYLFTFRVSLVTDERIEMLEHVLINSRSLREHRADEMFFQESLALPEEGLPGAENAHDLYVAACDALELKVASAVGACRENSRTRLHEEEVRIREYFGGLVKEAERSKYPPQAAAAIEAFRAEEEKRLEEARSKYKLEATVRLVGARTILVPTTAMSVRLTGSGKSREIHLEFDEVGLEIPPPKCEGCGLEIKEIGLCDEGHVTCRDCEKACAFCNHLSCKACGESLVVSQKCAECGRWLCGTHALRDDFGLGMYCPEHIVECSACGKKASHSFVTRCRTCNQKYCFLCVAAKDKSCNTCRSVTATTENDADVKVVKTQSAFAEKYAKWRKAKNRRFVILEGRAMLSRRTFVLDDKGKLVWEG